MKKARFPIIKADAPVRADLAGGTLDLWPLGLFEPGAATVAVALSLRVEARVQSRNGPGPSHLFSRDLNLERSFSPGSAPRRGKLQLMERLAGVLAPSSQRFSLQTYSPVRAGSGLGTSSALGIAAGGAFLRWQGKKVAPLALIPLIRDLEAQVLGIPTGTQDHACAALGGVVVLTYPPGEVLYRRGPQTWVEGLRERLLLVDSGEGRSSGPSNWDMVRRRIEREPEAGMALSAVGRSGARAVRALETGDWKGLGRAMREDAEARSSWSPLVMTPALKTIFQTAKKARALGWKVCGAGGGGFAAVLVAPERKKTTVAALEAAGFPATCISPDRRGLRISCLREEEF